MGEVPTRNSSSRCSICWNESKAGSDSSQVNKRLRFCVPEKKWGSNVFICSDCISDMKVTYGFRKRCLTFSESTDKKVSPQTSHSSYNCSKCSHTFRFQSQLFKHNLRIHNTQNSFDCVFCKRNFRTYLSKFFHEQRHLSRWQFKYANYLELWQKLNFKVNFKKRFGQNVRRTESVGSIEGNKSPQMEIDIRDNVDIDESVVISTELDEIKKEVEPEKLEVFACKKSDSVKLKGKKRGRKKAVNNNSEIFQCATCNAVFTSKFLIQRHLRNVHTTEKKYNCDDCDQKFTSMAYLNNHKLYHSRERPYICLFCGKAFITTSDLYHHEKIHPNKRAYKCDVCSKAFNTSSDLHKHRICVHLDRNLWKYECEICEKKFPLKSSLSTHVKVHTGERNFACHICEKKCISRSVLRKHVHTHSSVKKFKCAVCGLDYKYEKSMKIHLKKAHDLGNVKVPLREKKYFCHMCPKSYFANNKLQIHLRTHTGEKPYTCELCNKNFSDGYYIKHHMRISHKVFSID